MMWLGGGEWRQERVMNVDDGLRVLHDELGGKHLHVARKNDEINVVRVEKLDLLGFGFGFVFLRHRDVVEGYSEEIGVALGVFVVADHQGEVAGEFAIALAM